MIELLSMYDTEYYFDDMPPDEKDTDELIVCVLENASGMRNNIGKYNDSEINSCARKLINNGYLRGTVIDKHLCSWSRPTRRGSYYLQLLTSPNLKSMRDDF